MQTVARRTPIWVLVAIPIALLGGVLSIWHKELLEGWDRLQPADRAPFVSGAFTLASALAAAWVVFAQIKRNAEAQRSLQTESDTRKLRLEVYEKGSMVCRLASDALTEAKVRSLLIADAMSRHLRGEYRPIPERNPLDRDQFATLHKAACEGLDEAIFWIEKWLIVEPRLDVFRFALSSAHHDLIDAAPAIDKLYMKLLVTPVLKGKPEILSGKPDDRAYFDLMHDAWPQTRRYAEKADQADSYIADLLTALQNILLSKMFDGSVPPRRNIDPRAFPITVEGHVEAREKLADTPYGRHVARTEAAVREELRKRGITPAA